MLRRRLMSAALFAAAIFAIPSVTRAQGQDPPAVVPVTVTITSPAGNAPFKSGDPVFVEGGLAPAAPFVQVEDNALGTQKIAARLIPVNKYTTKSGSNPNFSLYTAPIVAFANTKVTITVTAYDTYGRLVGTKSVDILVSP